MLNALEIGENTLQPQELEREMIKEQYYTVIRKLYDKGMAKRAISRFLELDIKTVRRHLKKSGWSCYRRAQSNMNLLKDEQDWLVKRMPEVNYNAAILFRELKVKGYKGSYETVKIFVYPYRPLRSKGCIRYETEPGQQSQVDWGSAWVWLDEKRVKVHFFAMVLGYSRRLYVKGFLDEKFISLIQGHECAFQWFGGFTKEILYDNARTMVTSHNIHTGELILNTKFQDFSKYYGFEAKFCRPYRPQTKGKIESGIKYLKRNFLPGRRFKNIAHLNSELEKWLIETADQRIHGTTHQRPAELFLKEILVSTKQFQPYVYIPAIQRKVSQDSMVSWNNNRYSVPWIYVGQCLDLRISEGLILISNQGTVVATHSLLQGKHQQSVCRQHYTGLLQNQAKQQLNAPQYDPQWQTEIDVEIRDLAIYEATCTTTPHSFLTH